MKIRKASRVILLDENNRVLLFKFEDNTVLNPDKPINTAFWVTPGGSLEENESFAEAARREIWEETGIEQFELGEWIWTREQEMNWKGELLLSYEHYYIANVKRRKINLDNLTKQEQDVYRAHRWWSLDEIDESGDTFIPADFVQLLLPILAGTLPSTPICIE